MQQTSNYSLNKPEQTDVVNIEDLNVNFDIIDNEIKKVNDNKVSSEAGKGLSANNYTTAEKTKLSGISTNANNYTHPATHPPDIIAQNSTNRFVTDAEKASWNGKAGTSVATTSTNGLMSTTDKTKLDGVAAGANNYAHPSTHPASIITGLPASLPANGGNADTVGNLQPYQLGSLDNAGRSHGTNYPLIPKHNVNNDDRFRLDVYSNGSVTHHVRVGYADGADNVDGYHIQVQTSIPPSLANNTICFVYE